MKIKNILKFNRIPLLLITAIILSACSNEQDASKINVALSQTNTSETKPQTNSVSNDGRSKTILATMLASNYLKTSLKREYNESYVGGPDNYRIMLSSNLDKQMKDILNDKLLLISNIANIKGLDEKCIIYLNNTINTFYENLEKLYKSDCEIKFNEINSRTLNIVPSKKDALRLEKTRIESKTNVRNIIDSLNINNKSISCE